jgi:hypothetical protein
MARIVASLRRDAALAAASASALPIAPDRDDLERIRPAIVAARQGDRLLLFMYEDPASLISAALNQSLVRAMSPTPLGPELDSTHWSQAELAKWERTPTAAPSRSSDASDARWIWTLCLALIGLETWMRSRSRNSARAAEQSSPSGVGGSTGQDAAA